jgi:hypothetical protein
MDNKCSKTCYTLQGSQPYVLTANWPNGFLPPQTMWVPDLSVTNVRNYDKSFCVQKERGQLINFPEASMDKRILNDNTYFRLS